MRQSRVSRARLVLPVLAACLIGAGLSGCGTYRMGQAASDFDDLSRSMAACRESGFRNSETPPGADPAGVKKELGCLNVSAGLAKLSGEMAEAAKATGVSDANAVFYYRVAAMAAWLTNEPEVRDDVFDYTSEGRRLCGPNPAAKGVEQGNCALHHVLDPLVAHDRTIERFNALKASFDADRTAVAPAFFAETTAGGAWRLTDFVSRVHRDGMNGLVESLGSVCAMKSDTSVIAMMRAQYAEMRKNLRNISGRGNDALGHLAPRQARINPDTPNLCVGGDPDPSHPGFAAWTREQKAVVAAVCLAKGARTAAAALNCP